MTALSQGSAGHEGVCCMDGPLAFGNSDLEVGFALQYASQGRKAAVAASVVTTLLAALSLSRCISLAVADGLTPRLALLIAISSVLLCSHAWTLAAVVQPSQVIPTAGHCISLPSSFPLVSFSLLPAGWTSGCLLLDPLERLPRLDDLKAVPKGAKRWRSNSRMHAQVWRHESVKSANSLVGATACMMGSILSHHHELGLKAPVGITCIRGFLVLGETYRLTIALRLHAIQMVRDNP